MLSLIILKNFFIYKTEYSLAKIIIYYYFFQFSFYSNLYFLLIKAPLIYLILLSSKGYFKIIFLFNYLLKLSYLLFFCCLYHCRYIYINIIGLFFIKCLYIAVFNNLGKIAISFFYFNSCSYLTLSVSKYLFHIPRA